MSESDSSDTSDTIIKGYEPPQWDPAVILGLENDYRTCRGTTTKVVRCSKRASDDSVVAQLLDALRLLTPAAASQQDVLLSRLAGATLCSSYHQNQRLGFVTKWKAALQAASKREKAHTRLLKKVQHKHEEELGEIAAELRKLKVSHGRLEKEAETARERAAEAEQGRQTVEIRAYQTEQALQAAVADGERRVLEVEQQAAADAERRELEATQRKQQAEMRVSTMEQEMRSREAALDRERALLAEDRVRVENRGLALDAKFTDLENRRGRLDDEWSRFAAHRDRLEEQRSAMLTPRHTPEKQRFHLRDFLRRRRSGNLVASPAPEDVPVPSVETSTPPRTPEPVSPRNAVTLPDVPSVSPEPPNTPLRRKPIPSK